MLKELPGASTFAHRLRDILAQANITHEKSDFERLTVSMGLAISDDGKATFADLYDAADRSLYAAKRGGRDRLGPVEHIRRATPSLEPC